MLNHKKDRITIIAAILLISMKLAVWYIAPSTAIVLWVLVGSVLTFLLHPIRHNHTHVPVFKSMKFNRLFDVIVSAATLSNSIGIHVIHVLNHHQHNDAKEDWGRTSSFTFGWEFVNYLFYIIIAPFKMISGYKKWIKSSNNSSNKKRHRLENLIIYVILLILLIIQPLATLLYWILPVIGAFLMLVSFNYFQHRGCDNESEYNHSRNFTGRLMNLFVFNTGYHTIHHLFPSKHWSEIPRLHQQVESSIFMELNCRNLIWFFLKDILFSFDFKSIKSPTTFKKNDYEK